jgi:hypothetical protein
VTDSYITSIGTSGATSISLLGRDLAADLMGQVSFGELAFCLVALRRPAGPGSYAGAGQPVRYAPPQEPAGPTRPRS